MEHKLIDSGRTSDVFDYDENILKLYKEYMDKGLVEREFYFSKLAFNNNIKTPEPKSIIYEQNRKGIIFQKINGKPLLKIIIGNPLRIKRLLKKFVELQFKIHKNKVYNSGYTFKDYLYKSVERNEVMKNDDKAFIQKYIKKLPEGDNFCHGDFHPENVLLENNEYYVIDWMTGMQGNIAADLARTEMIIQNAEIPGKIPYITKKLMQIFQKKLSQTYIKEYCKISGMKKEEIDKWKLPLYVARLNENNSKEEENRLLRYIENEIKKQKTSA
jgi:uncharacterized protein (TIGR02172 family)